MSKTNNQNNQIVKRFENDDPDDNFYYNNNGITSIELHNPSIINKELNEKMLQIQKEKRLLERKEQKILREYKTKASFLKQELQIQPTIDDNNNTSVTQDIKTIKAEHKNRISELKNAVSCNKLQTKAYRVVSELSKTKNLIGKVAKNYKNFYPFDEKTLEKDLIAIKTFNILIGDAAHNQGVYTTTHWLYFLKMSIDYTANAAAKKNQIQTFLCNNCTNIRKKQFVLMSFDIDAPDKWRCLKCNGVETYATFLSSNHIKKNLRESIKIQHIEQYIVLMSVMIGIFLRYGSKTKPVYTATYQTLKRNKRGKYSE